MVTRFVETSIAVNGTKVYIKAYRDGKKIEWYEAYCYGDISTIVPNYVTAAIKEAMEIRIAEIDGTSKETKDE